MRWPFVSRRRYEALEADRERIRGERDQFAKDRDTFKNAAESASEKYTDTAIVNACLTEDLTEARQQLAAQEQTDMVPRAEYEAEKKRADHLQQRLDQAAGLDTAPVAAGANWQDRREQKMRFDS